MPSIGFDIFLKKTGIRIQLITDPEMMKMLEHGIRGGLSYSSTKYLRTDEVGTCIYIDQKNLYGAAQMCPLPLGSFEWLKPNEIAELYTSWLTWELNSEKGMILEVDLEYPQHLHELHSENPLAPESVMIQYDE